MVLTKMDEQTILWNLIAQRQNDDDKILSCDVAVPISQLSKIINEMNARIKSAGLLGSCLGHVGDSNFHATITYSEAEREKAEALILWCRRRAIEFNGTVTGEHGVGMALRDLVMEELGENATDMMRKASYLALSDVRLSVERMMLMIR
jgi:D-lactate dehydrogenase (cytochrome)